jgi:hypothetical protein
LQIQKAPLKSALVLSLALQLHLMDGLAETVQGEP